MRVVGFINKKGVVVLIDFGSTHNFLSQNVLEELDLTTDAFTLLKVGVASGQKLESTGF